MINIYDYLDYREFLRDYYIEKKKNNPHFSHRYIAQKLGFDSGYFAKITQTQRHISIALAEKFAAFFKLGSRESEYFRTLVHFCKAETHSEKREFFEKLISFKRSEARVLNEKQYRLFEKWYYVAVRELIACFDCKGDYEELGKRLIPPISEAKARKAVKVLKELGLIKKVRGGGYERVDPVWRTNTDIASVAVDTMQQDMLELAKESYDRFPRTERNMSTLTLSISKTEYEQIVKDLERLREKLLDAAKNCETPDRVYQCNFSVFPLSKAGGEEQ